MASLSVDDVALLTSAAGRELLASLPAYNERDALALATRLRREGHDPRLIALTESQARLRARGRDRLGSLVDRLLLTPDGLEQATRPLVAARHARRFADAGVELVHDLGCGLGLDALGFAEAGLAVRAVERDPGVAALAADNLRGDERVQVVVGDATEQLALVAQAVAQTPGRVGVWFDPARRDADVADAHGRTRRRHRLDQISPPWQFVLQVAAAVPATGAKLGPAFPRDHVPAGAQAEWVSVGGHVVECALWWGPLARHQGRSAVVLPSAAGHDATLLGPTGAAGAGRAGEAAGEAAGEPIEISEADAREAPKPGAAPQVGEILYDPDRAVVAAGLVGALAAATDGRELAEDAGYVVASQLVPLAWARSYRVVEVLPMSVKPVRAWLRTQGAGRVTLKKRGSSVDPDRFRAGLRLSGRGPEAILVLTRCATGSVALAVEPLASSAGSASGPPSR